MAVDLAMQQETVRALRHSKARPAESVLLICMAQIALQDVWLLKLAKDAEHVL
jgi:hypothetical protein